MSRQIKSIVIFLKEIRGKLVLWTRKPLKMFETSIKLKDKTFLINTNNVAYQKDNYLYYFIDYDNGNQYSFVKSNEEMQITPEQLDVFVSNNWLRQITGKLSANKPNIFLIVICSICSALMSVLITYIIMSQKIEEILTNGSTIIIG